MEAAMGALRNHHGRLIQTTLDSQLEAALRDTLD